MKKIKHTPIRRKRRQLKNELKKIVNEKSYEEEFVDRPVPEPGQEEV